MEYSQNLWKLCFSTEQEPPAIILEKFKSMLFKYQRIKDKTVADNLLHIQLQHHWSFRHVAILIQDPAETKIPWVTLFSNSRQLQ